MWTEPEDLFASSSYQSPKKGGAAGKKNGGFDGVASPSDMSAFESPTSVFGFPGLDNIIPPEFSSQNAENQTATILSSAPFAEPEKTTTAKLLPPVLVEKQGKKKKKKTQQKQQVIQQEERRESQTGEEEDDAEMYNLHKWLNQSDWKKLKRALAKLESNAPAHAIEASLSARNQYGETPIHTAAYKAPTKLMLSMLDLIPLRKGKEYLLSGDSEGNSPLHLACANFLDRIELSVIRSALLLAPQALQSKNVNGDTRKFLVIRRSSSSLSLCEASLSTNKIPTFLTPLLRFFLYIPLTALHLLVASPSFKATNDGEAEVAAKEAITSLLLASPSAAASVTAQNNRGDTLLHLSIANGAYGSVLAKLLEFGPNAVRVPDANSFLPIHFAAAFGHTPWPIVADMIRLFPESIRSQTKTGDAPLHLLLSNSHKFLKAEKTSKKSAKLEDLCLDRNTAKLAALLIGPEDQPLEKAPVLIRNKEDINPLHAAALFNTPAKLTRMLMDSPAGKMAAAATTSYGSTALHLACTSRATSVVEANLKTLSTVEACATTDGRGRTPLALAASNKKTSKKIIRCLCKVYPDAASIPSKGKLPLHLACSSKKSKPGVVKALLKVYPDGCKAVTAKGNTALHEACKHRAPTAVIELLLSQFPESLNMQNLNLELPVDLARANGASRQTVSLLAGSSFVINEIAREFSPNL